MAGRRTQLLGTSGTVTTVAGVHLQLPRYDRRRIDGCWLNMGQARAVTAQLLASSHAQRVAQPCIGKERADLVLAGCAILEAVLRTWPCARLRVADRGLREGILATLMDEDGLYRARAAADGSAGDMPSGKGSGAGSGVGGGISAAGARRGGTCSRASSGRNPRGPGWSGSSTTPTWRPPSARASARARPISSPRSTPASAS